MYSCNHSAWDNSSYNEYLYHQAQMNQWLQQLQQTIDPTGCPYCCNDTHARPAYRGHAMQHLSSAVPCCNPCGRPALRGSLHCCSAQARPACQPCCPAVQMPHQYGRAGAMHIPRNNMPSRGHPSRIPAGRHSGRVLQPREHPGVRQLHNLSQFERHDQVAQGNVEKQEEEESEDSMEEEDNSSSEDEIVCDVDAFIALRKGKDASDKVSEDSFELVDSVEDEKFKFEYVEMDEFGIIQRKYGKRREVNTLEDELLKKQKKEYLYGEKADAICGLETLMGINFDHFVDTNQPVLWPVLPLAL